MRTLSAEGIAIVFVSHRLAEVLEISSRVTVLRDGKLVGVYPTAGMTQSRLTELMTGKTFDQNVRDARPRSVAGRAEGRSPDARPGDYEDVSLTIRRGETLGLTGLLGAGRTELALSIFGMMRPDRGSVPLEGRRARPALQPRRDRAPASATSRRIACRSASFSRNRLPTTLSSPCSTRSSIGGLISHAARRTRWSLAGSTIWRSRSDGQTMRSRRSRAAISSASPSPNGWRSSRKLLILDSPTVGVDVGARARHF